MILNEISGVLSFRQIGLGLIMVKLIHITLRQSRRRYFFEGQIDYMNSKGFVVYALSSPGESFNQFGISERLPVHPIAMTREITPCYDFLALFCIWKRIQKGGTEIVHTHAPKGGLIGMICSWMAKVPVRFYTIPSLPMITAFGWWRQILRWSEKTRYVLVLLVLSGEFIVEAIFEFGSTP